MVGTIRSPFTLLLCACTLTAGSPTDWSTVKALASGAQVRVEAAHRKVAGRLRAVTDDSIVLLSDSGEQTIARAQTERVDIHKPSHRGRNALIGLAVGAGAGAGITIAASRCSGFGCIAARDIEIAAPLVLGALGAGIGALMPTGGWRQVYHAPAPVQ